MREIDDARAFCMHDLAINNNNVFTTVHPGVGVLKPDGVHPDGLCKGPNGPLDLTVLPAY